MQNEPRVSSLCVSKVCTGNFDKRKEIKKQNKRKNMKHGQTQSCNNSHKNTYALQPPPKRDRAWHTRKTNSDGLQKKKSEVEKNKKT